MKWSLFNWKKPVVSSGEPEDYQVVKNTVNQNTTNITNINNQLNNTVSTNTSQTITGAKTFNANVVISNNPTPLILKSTNNDKNYVVFRDSTNNSNLSIGANATSSSIEVNRGDLEIQTQQTNKSISINTGRVKLNRSALDLGTIINAGYGGTEVKFIPDDNSTKTLKFYENNQNDTRKFNLLVPEPTQANNPATKQYVDNAIAGASNANLESQINELNTFKTSVENSYGYNIRYQDIQLQNNGWLSTGTIGDYTVYQTAIDTVNDVKFLSASPHFNDINSYSALRTMFSALPRIGTRVYLNFQCYGGSNGTPNFNNSYVRVFYIDNISTRVQNPYYIVEEDN